MTKESIPELGQIPEALRSKVIPEPRALYGKWIEADKPLSELNSILSRLGLSAVKRRILGRCHCKVDIEPGDGSDDDEKLSDVATSAATETPTRTDDGGDLPSTAANTPGPNVNKWGQGLSLLMRQHFPMGRIRESTFVADGETLFDQEDPETDVWKATVWFDDGVLIQRRESEKLGVVMFDTRAVLSEPVELEAHGGKIEGLDPTEPVQLFQWIIVDQKTNETQTARYYLKKAVEDPSASNSSLPSSNLASSN